MADVASSKVGVSEEQLRLFVEHVPAAVAMFDREMRYLAASRRWAADFGLGDMVVHGRVHYDVFPDIPERWRAVHQRGLAGEVLACTDDRWERADGSTQWLHWEVQPWPIDDGTVGGILIFAEEVTDRKQAEEALRLADRRKDELLATLAHELRNPLAPIRTGFELLRRGLAVDDRTAKIQDVIERQLGHLIRLVDDLLDVSRIGRGIVELARQRISLATILQHAVEASRPIVESRAHALVVQSPDEPVWVDGDLTRLAQVVGNLLDNAAKYTPCGGHITLSGAAEGGDAVVRVTDDGIGIAAEMLPRVFEMFTQVDRALDRTHGGLGIGLSLARKLVELHDGTIAAASAGLGHGSTFVMRLPLAATRAEDAKGKGVADPAADAERAPRRRILVVDDNDDGAQTLAMLLELAGHETMVANSGPQALAAARPFAPDVVFLDIGMPGMDGHEVARRLRADPATADVMLVALTGWGSEDDERKSREAGFDLHLVKPMPPGAVGEVLARLAERRAGR